MILRVVFDTNVFLSAILFGGKPRECLEAAENAQVHGITSQLILTELETKLMVKFHLSAQDASDEVMRLVKYLEVVESEESVSGVCADPKDDMVLECAVKGHAYYIVSGDRKHLLSLGSYQGIQIVDPAAFLAVLANADTT